MQFISFVDFSESKSAVILKNDFYLRDHAIYNGCYFIVLYKKFYCPESIRSSSGFRYLQIFQ